MNTDGTGFHTCKECHKTESLWNHITTDHKEGEQLEDLRSVGSSSCNCGDGTDQRIQSLMFMMMMTVVLETSGITKAGLNKWKNSLPKSEILAKNCNVKWHIRWAFIDEKLIGNFWFIAEWNWLLFILFLYMIGLLYATKTADSWSWYCEGGL